MTTFDLAEVRDDLVDQPDSLIGIGKIRLQAKETPAERGDALAQPVVEVVVAGVRDHAAGRDLGAGDPQQRVQHQAALVCLSVTTLDRELARKLEPRATQPEGRLAAIAELTAAGVPVGVLVAPVVQPKL